MSSYSIHDKVFKFINSIYWIIHVDVFWEERKKFKEMVKNSQKMVNIIVCTVVLFF